MAERPATTDKKSEEGSEQTAPTAERPKNQGIVDEVRSQQSDARQQAPNVTSPPETEKSKAVSPGLHPWEIGAEAKKLLGKVDLDGNPKALNKEEMAKLMEDPTIKGRSAQALAAMYKEAPNGFNKEDADFFSNKKDLQNLEHGVDRAVSALSWAQRDDAANFKAADTDGDGHLATSELREALSKAKKHEASDEDKDSMRFISEFGVDLAEATPDEKGRQKSPSLADMKEWTSGFKSLKNTFKDMREASGLVADAQNANKTNSLYGTENPIDSIKPEAIKQGAIKQGDVGNCFFAASLAAVAQKNPELVRDAIKQNPDGSSKVTFPGAPDAPETVSPVTEASNGVHQHGGKHGTWPGVMEKAFGTNFKNEGKGKQDALLPAEGADGGGSPSYALGLLTGKEITEYETSGTPVEELHQHLSDIQKNNLPAVASTPDEKDKDKTPDGLYTDHSYTVMNYDSTNRRVMVRNPWGGTDATTTLSLDEFHRNFSTLTTVEH